MHWGWLVVTLFAIWGFESWSSRLLFPRLLRPKLARARVVKLPRRNALGWWAAAGAIAPCATRRSAGTSIHWLPNEYDV